MCTPTLKGTQFVSQFWAVTQEYFWNRPELLPEFWSVTDYCVLMTVTKIGIYNLALVSDNFFVRIFYA